MRQRNNNSNYLNQSHIIPIVCPQSFIGKRRLRLLNHRNHFWQHNKRTGKSDDRLMVGKSATIKVRSDAIGKKSKSVVVAGSNRTLLNVGVSGVKPQIPQVESVQTNADALIVETIPNPEKTLRAKRYDECRSGT